MSADHSRLRELFIAACDMSPAERVALLSESCGDDPEMRTELERLLRWDESTRGILMDDDMAAGVELHVAAPAVPIPLENIGRYRVKRLLGQGGMGVVWLAEQEHPKRDVAVKVIRSGIMSRDLHRRFELEAAVLGRLQHPGIAQVHEAGMYDDGSGSQPFFAMEYVDGRPLNDFVREQDLGLRDRLNMFIQICEAVHHAHQRGVIHRDLKPGNILVTADGRLKILDFGVARATDSDLQVSTLQSGAGLLIGTLPYMSPEQITRRGCDVDTRSDLYALGVILYELLADRLPYDLSNLSIVNAARTIADGEPAPLASVNRLYRGDLNTIVHKALEKDPERRYSSAAELAADVRRYLTHQPIAARPATALYQLRKFARRNRVLVGAAAIVCLVLLGASVWIAQAMMQTNRATSRALAINEFMDRILASADPATGRADVQLVEVLRSGAADAAARFKDHPELEADVHDLLGRSFQNLSLFQDAIVHLRRSHEIRLETLGPGDPATIQSAYWRSWVHYRLRQLDEALQIAQDALASMPPEMMDSEPALYLRRVIVKVRTVRGDFQGADAESRNMVAAARAAFGEDHGVTISTKLALAECLRVQIQRGISGNREALQQERYALLKEVSGPLVRLYGELGLETLHVMVNMAESLRRENLAEASALVERVLESAPQRFGADHDLCCRANGVLGNIRFDQRRFPEAADHALRRIEGIERRAGQENGESLAAKSDTLPIFDAAERLETGETHSRALMAWAVDGGHDQTLSLIYQAHLARFLSRQGRFDEAEGLFAPLMEAPAASTNEDLMSYVDLSYGGHLAALGRFDEAEPRLLAARNRLGARSLIRLLVEQELNRMYQAWGKPEQALQHQAFVEAPPPAR